MADLTTDPNDPRLGRGIDAEKPGQHKAYLVLSDEERAKGFIRPVRQSYRHTGIAGPKATLRALTPEEVERYSDQGYVGFEPYPESEAQKLGRFWTQEQLDAVDGGCGTVTTMSLAIAETYAREPHFYGATYCIHCSKHLPVAEFRWLDGAVVGS